MMRVNSHICLFLDSMPAYIGSNLRKLYNAHDGNTYLVIFFMNIAETQSVSDMSRGTSFCKISRRLHVYECLGSL